MRSPAPSHDAPTRRAARGLARGLALALGLAGVVLHAQRPEGGTVVAGAATIANAANSTVITAGNNSVLRWSSFNVGADHTVQFVQPGASARVLNWIGGLTPSQIDGALLANGRVYLLNPQGVYFGRTAVVDVAGLYAIGGSMTKEDFLSGMDRFSVTGDVRNAGSIRGDFVALVGRSVANTGSIVSPGGFIGLASGDRVYLGRNGGSIYVDAGPSASAPAPAPAAGTGVANSGTIDAGRGKAVLAAGDLYSVAIAHDGRLAGRDIQLQGQGRGDVLVSGTIDASARGAGETGGRVEVTGERVGLVGSASINASGPAGGGTILVGGDLHGANAAVRNASQTFVGAGATLNADATQSGHGGKVVVWSDNTTRFFGELSARGGPAGGNGGAAEVSGKQNLTFAGTADLGARRGVGGSLLLDPDDIQIVHATDATSDTFDTVTGSGPFTDSNSTATSSAISDFTINTQLASADVTIQTSSGGITDQAAVNVALGGRTLTLQSAAGITLAGSYTGGNLTLVGTTMSLGALSPGGLLTINNSGAATQSGIFGGSGGLTKTGAGTLTLSQANTYTGTTTVSNGTLALGAAGVLADTSSLVVGGGTFDLGGNAETVAGVQQTGGTIQNGTLTSTSAFDMQAGTASAVLAGSVALNKTTGGTVTLSGANTYTGGTALSAGTLVVGDDSALGSGTLTTSAGTTLQSTIGSAPNVTNPITLGAGTTTIYIPRSGGGDLELSGKISGSGALNITGDNQDRWLKLDGNNDFSGGVTLSTSAGSKPRIRLGNVNGLGSGTVTVQGTYGELWAFADLSAGVPNAIVINASSLLTLNSNGNSAKLSGVISEADSGNPGSLTKTGTGTWTLSGANTYTGVTTINGGTLSVATIGDGGVAGNLGQATNAAANLVFDGGTLQYTGGGETTDRLFTLTNNGGTIDASGTGALSFTSTGSVAFTGTSSRTLTLTGTNTGANTLAPVIGDNTGATDLAKSGAGAWTLGGANTYTGLTTISAGTLALSASGSIANSSVAGSGGTFDLSGTSGASIVSLSGSAAVTLGSQTLTLSNASGTYSGVLSGTGGALTLTAGTETLSGA
ncbi:MAG TPA: autotransporter-associated beta strand repeat-containing protein, partial [Lacunisphaera sp.]|nr:autotransporter-associated beta strand repeat-containing protein [Lacunisphaera sp.]